MKKITVISMIMLVAAFLPQIITNFVYIPLAIRLSLSALFLVLGSITGFIAWRKKEGPAASVFFFINFIFVLALGVLFFVISRIDFSL